MIFLFSSRTLIGKGQDFDIFKPFEDNHNIEHKSSLILAEAFRHSDNAPWVIELIDDDLMADGDCGLACDYLINLANSIKIAPDQIAPERVLIDRSARNTSDWIFYIPGYNSTLKSGLERAHDLEKFYAANIILFSWPANPSQGAISIQSKKAYRHAQKSAKIAASRLNQCLRLIQSQFVKTIDPELTDVKFNFCLLMHSLGNYVFQQSVSSLGGQDFPVQFDNVVLHQPDVDQFEKSDFWLPESALKPGSADQHSYYITFNEFDKILRTSELINGPRLGTPGSVSSLERVKFIDFTKARNAAGSHFFFAGSGNNIVDLVTWRIVKSDIFTRADLLGEGVTDPPLSLGLDSGGFSLEPDTNIFVFK